MLIAGPTGAGKTPALEGQLLEILQVLRTLKLQVSAASDKALLDVGEGLDAALLGIRPYWTFVKDTISYKPQRRTEKGSTSTQKEEGQKLLTSATMFRVNNKESPLTVFADVKMLNVEYDQTHIPIKQIF
jgi:hypothetical protein